MLRIINTILCIISAVNATADFSDLYLCSYGLEEEGLQTLDRTKFCIPIYSLDKSTEEMAQSRRKRSVEDAAESWPVLRVSRDQETIKTIHLPSSFTPRLGRRRAANRMLADPHQHVINLNAGTAFTPRLGRRVQN